MIGISALKPTSAWMLTAILARRTRQPVYGATEAAGKRPRLPETHEMAARNTRKLTADAGILVE